MKKTIIELNNDEKDLVHGGFEISISDVYNYVKSFFTPKDCEPKEIEACVPDDTCFKTMGNSINKQILWEYAKTGSWMTVGLLTTAGVFFLCKIAKRRGSTAVAKKD